METLDDVLSKALVGGDALKTAQLVNLTFTILAIDPTARVHTFEAKGTPGTEGYQPARESVSYVANIQIDGEADSQDAFLGGGWLTPQVEALIEHKKVPCRVKVITDSSKRGNPYILVPAPGPQPARAAEKAENGAAAAQPSIAAGNTQSPAERLSALFRVAVQKDSDLAIATVTTGGGGNGLQYAENGDLILNADALDLPTIVRLIGVLEK